MLLAVGVDLFTAAQVPDQIQVVRYRSLKRLNEILLNWLLEYSE